MSDEDPTSDEIESWILEAVKSGAIEFAGVSDDGEIHYRITEAGEDRLREQVRSGRLLCPVHNIRDCSPLLNGCTILADLRRKFGGSR